MVILRPTAKLRGVLSATDLGTATSDTALGDWYANRIVVSRQPLLLLASSASLLAVLLPARDVRNLPAALPSLVEARLKRLGIEDSVINAEIRAMRPVKIAATVDRSVLGIMVDFAKSIPYFVGASFPDAAWLQLVEGHLAENPCFAGSSARVMFAFERAPELLRKKWLVQTGQDYGPAKAR